MNELAGAAVRTITSIGQAVNESEESGEANGVTGSAMIVDGWMCGG